ncbi:MAG: thiamine pyrophosphate-dependent dehydrogenase E1 component subunit alpha, partial [SAR324 cluster bacterium]|nr:thiamine pyrophosphate-dependent dehydrogenase E1 component subunit alpha [SAR324 cluster bacterium]
GFGNVAVSYFGDGAMEEGVLHESMNFASNFKLPILLVCENNFFSSHLHVDLRQPDNSMARFAFAHKIPYQVIDGNDVIAVSKAAAELIHSAREGKGPGFLETVTYRWRGHVGPREDIDVGVNRSDELGLWKKRDPVQRLWRALRQMEALIEEEYETMKNTVYMTVEEAWQRAEEAPFPEQTQLLNTVYHD